MTTQPRDSKDGASTAIVPLIERPEGYNYRTFDWKQHTKRREMVIKEEMYRRVEHKRLVESSDENRATALALCAQDFEYFCNSWAWTYNPWNPPDGLPAVVPFVLRPKQQEFARWLAETLALSENGLIEKSREEGLTWMVGTWFVWKWLFTDGFKAGIGSRKLDLVDQSDNMDAIFPKLRFVLDMLPSWMMPTGYKNRDHNKYCRLVNPERGSSITGEGGDDIGRGGRNTIYFVDEHPKLANPEQVEMALSQNSRCILYGGTPFGTANLFYQKRMEGKTRLFTFHWMSNPEKNFQDVGPSGEIVYPWYERMREKFDPVVIAQEVDIDYAASLRGLLIPAAYIEAAEQITLEKTGKRQAGLDVSDDGGDATIEGGRVGGVVIYIDSIDLETVGDKAYHAAKRAEKMGMQALAYDKIGVGAGARGVLESSKGWRFRTVPVVASKNPSSIYYDDMPDWKAKARFENLGAELWWNLRLRFYRTWMRVSGQKHYPDEDCISLKEIMNHPKYPLIRSQLSQPLWERTSRDKVRVDKKGGKKKKSPDWAECLMLMYAHSSVMEITIVDKQPWM